MAEGIRTRKAGDLPARRSQRQPMTAPAVAAVSGAVAWSPPSQNPWASGVWAE